MSKSTYTDRKLAALIAALSLVPLSGSVLAQSDDADSALLEEVMVTATKREQTLQEIPLSRQAFDNASLQAAAIRDLGELMTFVPGASEMIGLTVGQRTYQIRGTGGSSGDAPVGYYIDDSPFFTIGGGFAPIGNTFDMERVEVLRGPQSTLYGNGNMGGTVRYVTNKPNPERFEAHARGSYSWTDGGDPGWYGDAALNIPLGESVALRVVGSHQEVGGYTEDVFGNENQGDAMTQNFRGI